ncbi:hypothetical protein AAFN88_16145 [Pelagibius sp. CAU 1746]|uniref:hypothetical protein n=1 Tax=Pelagibius sp. CAU 1746 TaxID=3140370 RepID=UPI00325AD73A
MKLPFFGTRPRRAQEPSAAVYLRDAQIVLHSQSKTDVGVWIACAPFLTLASDSSDQELGEAVLAALAGSKENVPHPNQSKRSKIVTPLLKAAKVKSWNTFARDTSSVSLRQRENTTFFTPMENQGTKSGFVDMQGSALSILDGSAQEVGAALREALDLAGR